MSKHDDLAPTGSYNGPDPKHEDSSSDDGTEVRALEAEDDRDPNAAVEQTVQLSHSADRSRYRLRNWREGLADYPGYTELSRHPKGELAQALEQLPDKPRFVVFENTDTGEVYLDRENNLGDNWTGDGKFDQVTLFEDETDAAEYAEKQQG